jgi:hypothetical protein
MFDQLRKSLSLALAWFLVAAPTAQAQDAPPSSAPVPPQILSAHSVFISNGGGSNYYNMFTGGPDRAYNTFYAVIERANRYQLVSTPAQADLVFEIRGIAPTFDEGRGNVGYNPQLILSIRDPQSSTVLWTTTANVRAIGRQKSRDRQFDQSIEVLVDKLSAVTGQPLSPEQAKAIRDNSRWPTAAKVILVVSLAAAAGFTAWGIYRVSHPPALPTPTLPSVP